MNPENHHDELSSHEVAFRDFRAPKDHGDAVVEPGFESANALLGGNVDALGRHGEWWASIRKRARARLLKDAKRYTSTYRDIDWVGVADGLPIVMSGHQPTIFHSGVWFKNFALDHIARSQNAVGINLVVDNDIASGSSLRVPSKSSRTGNAVYQLIPYDQAGGGIPFEQRQITDRDTFERFEQAVSDAVNPFVQNPCVSQLWKHARAALERCGFAGCALAQARHALEAEIGLRTLEIPLGVVCRSREFSLFALEILRQLGRFQKVYNEAASIYRLAHGIRSSAHPVPDLAQKGDWLEAPFWMYSDASPQRKSVWVRTVGKKLEISDRAGNAFQVGTDEDAVDAFAQIITGSIKFRPRALVTTMYARLVLSDLFLHGIGGAKYDQLGDMITEAFFGISPPDYMVLSATIQLPGSRSMSNDVDVRSVKRKLRDVRFQPERFAEHLSNQKLVDRKVQLLESIPPKGSRLSWHREVAKLNREMANQLSALRDDLQRQLQAAELKAASDSILRSREHPFCVFPLEYLVQNFQALLASHS